MIKAIYAVDATNGLGYRGKLPWAPLQGDMKYFKKMTTGHVVVMGAKTWLSAGMPHPLPNRINIVASYRNNLPEGYHTRLYGNLVDQVNKLQEAYPTKDVWIIGGASLLRQVITLVTEQHITRVFGEYKADTFVSDSLLSKFSLKSIVEEDTKFRIEIWKPYL